MALRKISRADDERPVDSPPDEKNMSVFVGGRRGPPPAKQSAEHRRAVAQLLVSGVDRDTVFATMATRYGLTEVGVRRIMGDFREQQRQRELELRETSRMDQYDRLVQDMARARADGDIRTAVSVETRIAKLLGHDVEQAPPAPSGGIQVAGDLALVLGTVGAEELQALAERGRRLALAEGSGMIGREDGSAVDADE
jgi:hypothetical protein